MPPGSVLFSSRAPIGYVAISSGPVSTNQGFKSFVPESDIEPSFLYYYLQRAKPLIVRLASGTTFKEISGAKIATVPVPLTPTEEQRRIVEAIESYLSRLDAAVANLERAQAKLRAYRASVLKAAVEGRLVPIEADVARVENRDYEPADVLLKRILAERRRRWEEAEVAKLKAAGKAPKDEKWKAKYEQPLGPNSDGLPELPEGWSWATMPQLGELSRGKSMHRPRNDPRLLGGPYPFIQTADVKAADTWIRNYESTYSQFGLAQSRLWPVGTMCITIAANIAETGILTFDACFPDSVVGFLQEEPTITRYVEMFIRTARQHLDRYAPATAQKNINLQTLSDVAIPLPPLAEQRRIVEELDRLLSVASTSLHAVRSNELRCARLRQATLKWAFEGMLVDQDLNDEPAEKLLERIRAERAASAPAKTPGSRRAKVAS
jgi:type I restriction enzyme S subunit